MSKKQEFIDYVELLMSTIPETPIMSENVQAYWSALKNVKEEDKPMFTDNGKLIMQYLQSLPAGGPMLKAKDIAEGMFISSRAVSGSLRKLVTDGFVEKVGQDPVIYALTDLGKNIKID